MTTARAIKLDESYAHPTALGFGDGVEPIETIRARYREQGPMRLKGKFTAKQRDLLGVLRSAGRPISFKEMFLALGALPRTWVGYDSQGLSMTLERLAVRGLAEKIPAPPSPRKMAPKVLWQISELAVQMEAIAPVADLSGVGPETGAHYLNRKPGQRRVRRVTLRLVPQPVEPDTTDRTDAKQTELDALIKEQHRQQRFGEFGYPGERPVGSPSIFVHKWMPSFDAPVGDARGSSEPNRMTPQHDMLVTKQQDSPHEELLEADRREKLEDILGTLNPDRIDLLDEDTLDHLRQRLREEDLVSISVMRSERERLRVPAPHRGRAPAPERTRMSTKHKHRKPGHQSSAGGSRGSRKSRKRWARDTGEW